MATQRWKVTLVIDIDESSHPRKFIPEAVSISMGLKENEDLVDYEFEEVSDDFELLSSIKNNWKITK